MNRLLSVIRRLGLGIAVACCALCVMVLACVAPARAVVELAYFYVTFRPTDVLISWGTASEVTTVGFDVYRTETPSFSPDHRLDECRREAGGGFEPQDYSCVDSDVAAGITYYYWLEVLDLNPAEDEVFGPEPTPTPTPTSTSTTASVATATSTSVATRTPTPTSTSVPTVTPSLTATGVPTSTPAGTPMATPVLPPSSSPSSTSVVEQQLSPTVTTGGIAQPTLSPAAAATEWMPTPASTTVGAGSETPAATTVAWGGDSEPGATGWSSFLFRWSTIQPSTILLLVSLISLLGALLLVIALALVRKLSL